MARTYLSPTYVDPTLAIQVVAASRYVSYRAATVVPINRGAQDRRRLEFRCVPDRQPPATPTLCRLRPGH